MQQELRHNTGNSNGVNAVGTASHIAKTASIVPADTVQSLVRVLLVSVLITPLRRAAWMPVT